MEATMKLVVQIFIGMVGYSTAIVLAFVSTASIIKAFTDVSDSERSNYTLAFVLCAFLSLLFTIATSGFIKLVSGW